MQLALVQVGLHRGERKVPQRLSRPGPGAGEGKDSRERAAGAPAFPVFHTSLPWEWRPGSHGFASAPCFSRTAGGHRDEAPGARPQGGRLGAPAEHPPHHRLDQRAAGEAHRQAGRRRAPRLQVGRGPLLSRRYASGQFTPTAELSTQLPPHPCRLFLSAEPPPALERPLPASILQASILLTNEPPEGLKPNLLRAYANFNEEIMEGCAKNSEFRRVRFGGRGREGLLHLHGPPPPPRGARRLPFMAGTVPACVPLITRACPLPLALYAGPSSWRSPISTPLVFFLAATAPDFVLLCVQGILCCFPLAAGSHPFFPLLCLTSNLLHHLCLPPVRRFCWSARSSGARPASAAAGSASGQGIPCQLA